LKGGNDNIIRMTEPCLLELGRCFKLNDKGYYIFNVSEKFNIDIVKQRICELLSGTYEKKTIITVLTSGIVDSYDNFGFNYSSDRLEFAEFVCSHVTRDVVVNAFFRSLETKSRMSYILYRLGDITHKEIEQYYGSIISDVSGRKNKIQQFTAVQQFEEQLNEYSNTQLLIDALSIGELSFISKLERYFACRFFIPKSPLYETCCRLNDIKLASYLYVKKPTMFKVTADNFKRCWSCSVQFIEWVMTTFYDTVKDQIPELIKKLEDDDRADVLDSFNNKAHIKVFSDFGSYLTEQIQRKHERIALWVIDMMGKSRDTERSQVIDKDTQKILEDKYQKKLAKMFVLACTTSCASVALQLKNLGVRLNTKMYEGFFQCCKNFNERIFKMFVESPRFDVSINGDQAFKDACVYHQSKAALALANICHRYVVRVENDVIMSWAILP